MNTVIQITFPDGEKSEYHLDKRMNQAVMDGAVFGIEFVHPKHGTFAKIELKDYGGPR